MPRYDYECKTCHHTFELKQSFNSNPVADCLACGKEARRVIHSVPVVFKGSGWYVNDYGKGGVTKSVSKDESEPNDKPESPKKDKPKSEKKPGKKSTTKKKEG